MKKIKNISNKVIKVTAVVALTLASVLLKANTGNEVALQTEKTIKQHIKFASLVLNETQNEKVEVIFTTSENGKVDFVLAKTKNETLKKDIEKQFLGLTLNKLKANVAYSIVFNFKTL